MYNRYRGNSGRVERVHDEAPARGETRKAASAPQHKPGQKPAAKQGKKTPTNPGGALGSLASLLPKSLGDFETEDLLLALILYLMYRESGNRELLIIMGGLFLF